MSERKSCVRWLAGVLVLAAMVGCPPPPATTGPITVSMTSPTAGATCVSTTTAITLTFSAAVNSRSISATIDSNVTFNEAWAADNLSITYTPQTPLAEGTTFTVEVTAIDGQTLKAPFTFQFTTFSQAGCGGGNTGTTFYVSDASGNDSNPGTMAQPWKTIQKAANTLTAGQTVIVLGGTYREQVKPQNSGTSGNPITYMANPNDTVIIDAQGIALGGQSFQAGAIDVRAKNHLIIEGFRVHNAGPDPVNEMDDGGIMLLQCNNIVVRGCYTQDTVSSGIAAWGGTNITFDNNEVVRAVSRGRQECMTISGVNGFEVKNNKVHDNGPEPRGGEGIDVKDGSSNGSVHGNEVYNIFTRGLGIYIEAGQLRTSNIDVYNNIVHHIPVGDGINLASELGGALENIRVFNNLVFATARDGITVSINNDGIANISRPMNNITIINNTVFDCGMSGNPNDPLGGITIANPEATNVVIRNNICSQNGSFGIGAAPGTSAIIEFNLVEPASNSPFSVPGLNVVTQSPNFVNPAVGDFHIQSNSPAIDAGSANGAPATDLDGISRPRRNGIDIGCFEFPN